MVIGELGTVYLGDFKSVVNEVSGVNEAGK